MSSVIKPDPDADWYVVWSDLASGGPLVWGCREDVLDWLAESRNGWDPLDSPRARLDRADHIGSSALWLEFGAPAYSWEAASYRVPYGSAWLSIDQIREACERLDRNERAYLDDLLVFDDTSTVTGVFVPAL